MMPVATSWTHLLSQENKIDVMWQGPPKGAGFNILL